MTAGYDTLIVTFSDPIKVLDNSDPICVLDRMFADADAWGTDTLKGWVEDYESTRFTQINEHTAVITSEYNMPCVKEWLTHKRKHHEILFYTDRRQGRMDAVRLLPHGRLCARLYP